MTAPFLTDLPAPGSMAAHDCLRMAKTLWTLAEAAFDADPSRDNAKLADRAWMVTVSHALNCGMSLAEPDYQHWITRRLAAYGASLDMAPMGVVS